MSRSSRLVLCAGALAAAVCVVTPRPERANGRFPQAIDVRFKPGDADTYAVQATYGLLVTNDAGQTWHWICEDAVGFGGVYDPDYAFTSTGLLLATTTSKFGLRLTRDFCAWNQAPADLNNAFVSQVAVSSDGTIYAARSTDGDAEIWVSIDDGASFQIRSTPGINGDWWETMEVAPSDPDILYLTGFRFIGPDKVRVMFRSDDAAMTWEPLPVTDFTFGGERADLQIAAISPTDPDVVFARVYQANGSGIGDDIYRSVNGGATWVRVFQSGDDVTSVVVRASGAVVLSTRLSGLHQAPNVNADFGPAITSLATHCLRERDGTLYMCGNGAIPDAMGLGTSTTTTGFVSQLRNTEIDGVLDCAAGTTQHDVCETQRWCGLVCQIAIDGYPECDPSCPAVDIDAGLPGPDANPVDEDPKDDCCNVGGGPAGASVLSAFVGFALLLGSRRRGVRR